VRVSCAFFACVCASSTSSSSSGSQRRRRWNGDQCGGGGVLFFVLTCESRVASLLYYTERTLHYKVHGMMIMMMTMMYTR